MLLFEGVHPLEGGVLRLKYPPRPPPRHAAREPVRVLSALWGETADQACQYWSVYRRARRILDEVLTAPDRWTYTDLAIAPPQEDEFEALDLYHATSGGEAALARKRRDDAIRVETDAHRHAAPAEAAE